MRRRSGLILALPAILAVAGTAFALAREPYAPHPAPRAAADCNNPQASRGDLPMAPIAFDTTSGRHRHGTTAVVHACIGGGPGLVVDVTVDGSGVAVTPRRFVVDGSDDPPRALTLTVAPGGHGTIHLAGRSSGFGFTTDGPRVVSDDGGWHVEPWAG